MLIASPLLIPHIVAGPPAPFFVVENHDVYDHNVVIDVSDSHNTSIMSETYKLESNSEIVRKRPLGLRLPLSKGEFAFNVTVDNKTMGTYNVEIPHRYTMVEIKLYYEDYTGNMTLITVEAVGVD
ncbi:hypothetical protein [Methanococcoides sp. LMO-2]|uniref:Uncharacterized protein n=1 Tax=Methanococcoides cohabitans TaxID=3136559 RepID=A0ABU9KUF0_9EURY